MKNIDIKFFEKRNRLRNYLHFDKKLSNEKILQYVLDKEKIAKHSFFPTISYILNDEKICRQNKKKVQVLTANGKIEKQKTKITKKRF